MNILHNNSIQLFPHDLEQLMQSLLFYSDNVMVRGSSNIIDKGKTVVLEKFRQLYDFGVLKTWAHEYEVNDGGLLKNPYKSNIFNREVNRVLLLKNAKLMVEEMNDIVNLNREDAYKIVDKDGKYREGVGELVQHRRNITQILLIDNLGLDGLHFNSTLSDLDSSFEKISENSKNINKTIDIVVDKCSFGSLAGLSIESLQRCRKHMQQFRENLIQVSNAGNDIYSSNPDSQKIAKKIMDQYKQLLQENRELNAISYFGSDGFWDVIGGILPPVLAVKYFKKIIKWSNFRKKFKPFLLIGAISKELDVGEKSKKEGNK